MTEITDKDIERADKWLALQKARVEYIACVNNINIDIIDINDELIFALFDDGDSELTDEEILAELLDI